MTTDELKKDADRRERLAQSTAFGRWFVAEPEILRFAPGKPWVNVVLDIPPGGSVVVKSRAHLDRDGVRALSKVLNYWLKHGRLPTPGGAL